MGGRSSAKIRAASVSELSAKNTLVRRGGDDAGALFTSLLPAAVVGTFKNEATSGLLWAAPSAEGGTVCSARWVTSMMEAVVTVKVRLVLPSG